MVYKLGLKEFFMYVKVVEYRVEIDIVPIGWNPTTINGYTQWALKNNIT